MGEVHRARDTRLKRDVALKVLPEVFANADRMARFQREAEVLASRNHPNIAHICGVEERGTCLIGTVGACQVLSGANHCVDPLDLGVSLASQSASDPFCEKDRCFVRFATPCGLFVVTPELYLPPTAC
jgi:serine/threonine-protein kinase